MRRIGLVGFDKAAKYEGASVDGSSPWRSRGRDDLR